MVRQIFLAKRTARRILQPRFWKVDYEVEEALLLSIRLVLETGKRLYKHVIIAIENQQVTHLGVVEIRRNPGLRRLPRRLDPAHIGRFVLRHRALTLRLFGPHIERPFRKRRRGRPCDLVYDLLL
ncbi:MAG TPA: hypothetical protein VLC46_15895 [Thermoanaerobaculia bacterium]|nr:hypothetical protein [Thermoanaerobaculia bacterium]